MPSLKALKSFCAVSAAVLILAGCGGGSGSSSTSSASASSPASSVPASGSTGSSGSSGSTSSSGSSSSTGSSGSGSSGSGSSGSGSSGSGGSTAQGSATLKWTAPTANNNGSALTNLAGYYIYYGTNPGSLSNVINVTSPSTLTYVVSNLGAGTWYFAVAAYTNNGVASPMSNVGSKTIS